MRVWTDRKQQIYIHRLGAKGIGRFFGGGWAGSGGDRSLFQSAFWLLVLLLFQIFSVFHRLLFLALLFVLFAAFVSHCVPPLALPVIFLLF